MTDATNTTPTPDPEAADDELEPTDTAATEVAQGDEDDTEGHRFRAL